MLRHKQGSFKEKEPSQEDKAGVDGEPFCHSENRAKPIQCARNCAGCQTTDHTELSVDQAGETDVIINKA